MAETAIAYHTQADTDGAEILDRFRAIIEERDTLRAKCAKQGRVITKLVDLMGELQEFIDDGPQEDEASAPAAIAAEATVAEVATETVPFKTITPDDATVAGWAEEHRRGTSCADIAARYGVSKFVISGHVSQWKRRHKGQKPEPELETEFAPAGNGHAVVEPEPAAIDAASAPAESLLATTPLEATASNAPSYDDDTIAAWVRALDSGHTTVEEIAEHVDENPYLVRGLVRGWREEHGVTVKED